MTCATSNTSYMDYSSEGDLNFKSLHETLENLQIAAKHGTQSFTLKSEVPEGAIPRAHPRYHVVLIGRC
ncbi:hypothetical protein CDAR_481421 [Caerostris darwini]|uniref:Uncharacterized protein n=1 Tax=Caerostris darwini TaxID=1538125 RepID=A0AAV4N7K0_9ARAC|nr:hypothetical protein CDAR_481421 [Caerostris darwini]